MFKQTFQRTSAIDTGIISCFPFWISRWEAAGGLQTAVLYSVQRYAVLSLKWHDLWLLRSARSRSSHVVEDDPATDVGMVGGL